MNGVTIRRLQRLDVDALRSLNIGYTSYGKYAVVKHESEETTTIKLSLVALDAPYRKRFEEDEHLNAYYATVVPQGYSFGAWLEDVQVGIAICEIEDWNNTLKVWEFHVDHEHQGRGIGRAMMERVIAHAREENVRVISAETQNTNVPAIRFYRAMGFEIGAVDLSLYENDDVTNGEVAVFMKYAL
jgi:ribosomal protein S18 acetylase RimI-like enzyme